jgi:hypothetical protein
VSGTARHGGIVKGLETMKTWLLSMLALAVFVLHQDVWNWKTCQPLVFGFLPVGLAYHAGFSALCAVMMALLVKFAWPAHLERIELRESAGSDADA